MSFPLSMKCKKCGREIGTIISPDIDRLAPLKLEFACPDCVEKTALSKAITLDSETSWGKVIAELKGPR
jgi:DNA-directed RNA polymerase subunit RPC12/RpoP